jgi:hypothetical protein
MARKAKSRPRTSPPGRRRTAVARAPRFVGRDASPVLEKYPPKDPALAPRGPPTSTATPAPPKPNSASATPDPSAPIPLISLERPFDVDDFSSMLGETSVRVTVPREDLAEVLRRVSEFMGFGIYVYSISVRPTPGDLLKSFVVELQRVDYAPEKSAWVPFEEKGTSDSPFGPSGHRT